MEGKGKAKLREVTQWRWHSYATGWRAKEKRRAVMPWQAIVCLSDTYENAVYEWLNYGRWRGIGQWRNASYGRFTWDIRFNDKQSTKE